MDDTREKRLQHFIERVGVFFESAGSTRMHGRILGQLLVCDPPEQSTSQLAEALMASKGSISTGTRVLIQMGMVEKVRLPGDRQHYFRLRPNAWEQSMRARMGAITVFRELCDDGLAALGEVSDDQRARLEEMRDFYAFLEREFPVLIDHWHTQREGE